MIIIAWNLNHRTTPKRIPLGVISFLSEYLPDLVVLSEFVDSPLHNQFYDDVETIGYTYSAISKSYPKQNQILILSRIPLLVGDIQAPRTTEAAETNFLHVNLPQQNIEVVGFLAPAYKLRREKNDYWAEVASIATRYAERNIIFVGDLNFDPFVCSESSVESLSFAMSDTYSILKPEGEWSYMSSNGTRSSRIDHAIVSSTLSVSEVRYIAKWGNIQLAGPKSTSPITDHAVLSLSVNPHDV